MALELGTRGLPVHSIAAECHGYGEVQSSLAPCRSLSLG